jgi:CO dehydrogenase/acetyl-CoA synthase beta subunit
VAGFDPFIAELREAVAALPAEHRRREFHWPGPAGEVIEGMCVKVGPGANPGIILRSDTYVEVGNPIAGSLALTWWTDDPALLDDGRITLVGPDIPESESDSMAFAQVLLVGGPTLSAADQGVLQQCQHVGDEVEGYMLKSTADSVWGRVSRRAAAAGFDFETLGRAYLHLLKSALPRASAAEVLFVTAGKAEVRSLLDLADRSRATGTEMVTEVWRDQGFDVDCSLDCSVCESKPVCDDIREVLAERKADTRVRSPMSRSAQP